MTLIPTWLLFTSPTARFEIMRKALGLHLLFLICLTAATTQASHAKSLCRAGERIVFSCQAGAKTVSLCAAGTGLRELTYRFGAPGRPLELEYSNKEVPVKARFWFDSESWPKGSSSAVSFEIGGHRYVVYHAHGVFGVDGGPNRAGVRVERGEEEIANIACHEKSAIDRLSEELRDSGLAPARADHSFAGEWEIDLRTPAEKDARAECGSASFKLRQTGGTITGETMATVGCGRMNEGGEATVEGTATGNTAVLNVTSGRSGEVVRGWAVREGDNLRWETIEQIKAGEPEGDSGLILRSGLLVRSEKR
ncbi:hypothetical protein [Pseudoduganella sp. OTU4001]|uniref:hypothetical protein n=1 Tax=Pseudoduganella sp. OTU4001 TaxID=3043854 RepID=UPI00313D58C4